MNIRYTVNPRITQAFNATFRTNYTVSQLWWASKAWVKAATKGTPEEAKEAVERLYWLECNRPIVKPSDPKVAKEKVPTE